MWYLSVVFLISIWSIILVWKIWQIWHLHGQDRESWTDVSHSTNRFAWIYCAFWLVKCLKASAPKKRGNLLIWKPVYTAKAQVISNKILVVFSEYVNLKKVYLSLPNSFTHTYIFFLRFRSMKRWPKNLKVEMSRNNLLMSNENSKSLNLRLRWKSWNLKSY